MSKSTKTPQAKKAPSSTQRTKSRRLGEGRSSDGGRRAAAVLEVLGGARTPREAAAALGITVNYYYILERKALMGLAAACEPAPKGPPGPSPEKRLAQLERELERCRRDCQRQAALVRATQRAVGLPASEPATERKSRRALGSKRRRRRPGVRALLAAQSLHENSATPEALETKEEPTSHEVSLASQTGGAKHGADRQKTVRGITHQDACGLASGQAAVDGHLDDAAGGPDDP